MGRRGNSSTPSQVHVPAQKKYDNPALGMPATSIQGTMMTPNRESIGTRSIPVPGEGGGAEFIHEMHRANGATRRGK